MTMLPELEAQILRYYQVDKWRTGTIAAQRGVPWYGHPYVGSSRSAAARRASAIDPYLPCSREPLEKFPTLTASRLYAMVKSRG